MMYAQGCLRALKRSSCDNLFSAAEDNSPLPNLHVKRFDGGNCH